MAANAVVLNGRQGRARIERFARLVRELETYLGLNTSALVDYGRRYRAGLPISTSRAESTVNSLVNMRMNKRADALVATRRSPRAAGPRCCGRRPALGRSASSDRLIIPTFVPLPTSACDRIPAQRASCPNRLSAAACGACSAATSDSRAACPAGSHVADEARHPRAWFSRRCVDF
jgi:hypothetical protein